MVQAILAVVGVAAAVVVLAAPLAGVHPGAAARAGARAAARRGDAGARRWRRRSRRRSPSPPRPVQIAFIATFALFPAAFLLGLLRTRFFRTATVGRLIEQLAADRDLRDALADALGDPTLDVAYWLPERGYVDRDGHTRSRPRGAS